MQEPVILEGYIQHANGFFFVGMYTCNKRCCETTEKNKLYPERDICCDIIKIMLDKESQSKVTFFDIINFEILDYVEELIDSHAGLYGRFIGKVNKL